MAKPTKHGDKWRIRWLDERGKRQSTVFDDYKRAQAVTVPEWTPSRRTLGLRLSRAMAKRDAESWAAIVAEAEAAGVPHGKTAERHGVSLATLKYHLYKSRGAGTKKRARAPRLLPVRVVTFFDSLGLGFFAVVGSHKARSHGANIEAAIVLGAVTAIGGGVLRDVLLNRVPAILAKEIYALAALVAAMIQVVAEVNGWPIGVTPWFAASVCFVIRFLALRYSWGLPVVGGE